MKLKVSTLDGAISVQPGPGLVSLATNPNPAVHVGAKCSLHLGNHWNSGCYVQSIYTT